MRVLDRVALKDHVTSSSLLLKYNLPSVNQLVAEIKLIEAWKSQNILNYPFKLEIKNPATQVEMMEEEVYKPQLPNCGKTLPKLKLQV